MKRVIPILGASCLLISGSATFGEPLSPPPRPGSRPPQQQPDIRPRPPGFPQGGGDVILRGGEAKLEKKTYLGVMSEPVQPPLRAQLGLADETGLVVGHVEKDSPAAKADLKMYDVLLKLDDQLLVNRDQLRSLVQAHKAGDSVKLSLIRGGKPLEATVKLEEHEVRSVMQFQPIGQDRVNQMNELMKRMQERMQGGKIDDAEIQKLMEQMRKQVDELNERMQAQQGRFGMPPNGPRPGGQGGPGPGGRGGPNDRGPGFEGPDGRGHGGPPPFPPPPGGPDDRDGRFPPPPRGGDDRQGPPPRDGRPPRDEQQGNDRPQRPGAEARSLIVEPEDAQGVKSSSNVVASSSYADDKHSITITNTNGDKHLTAKDAAGTQLFDGPINTAEQRKAIPADVAAKLDRLEAQTKIRIHVQPGPPPQRDGRGEVQ